MVEIGVKTNTGGLKEFDNPTDKDYKDPNKGLDRTAQIRDKWETREKQKKIIAFIFIAIIIYIILKYLG